MAKRITPVLLAGALLLLLAAVGPAEAAFPGTNGKIAYESAERSDAETRSTNPDGKRLAFTRDGIYTIKAARPSTATKTPTGSRPPVAPRRIPFRRSSGRASLARQVCLRRCSKRRMERRSRSSVRPRKKGRWAILLSHAGWTA